MAGFTADAERLLASPGATLAGTDSAGVEILNTAMAFGAASAGKAQLPPLSRGQAAISGSVMEDPASQRIVVPMSAAVPGERSRLRSLYLLLPASIFERVILEQDWPEGWQAVLVDAEGQRIAWTRNPGSGIGRAIVPWLRERLVGDSGQFDANNFDGQPSRLVYARLRAAPWYLVLAAPIGDTWQMSLPLSPAMTICSAFLLVLPIIMATLIGRRIVQPLRMLRDAGLGSGTNGKALPESGPREVLEVAANLREAAGRLQRVAFTARRDGVSWTEREFQHAALKAARTGTWRFDSGSDILEWDEEARGLLGTGWARSPVEDIIGRNIHEDDGARFRSALQALTAGTCLDVDFRVRHADGEIRWLRQRGEIDPGSASGAPIARGILANIDIEKNREQRLAATADRYHAVVESVSEAVLTFDDTSLVLSANSATSSLFDCGVVNMVGLPVRRLLPDLFPTPAEESALDPEGSGPRLANSAREAIAYRLDGTPVEVELSLTEWQADGERCYTAVIRDLSAKLLADQASATLRAELAHSQKMDSIGQLTGGIAHDFNNLLLAISLNLESLDDEIGDTPTALPMIEGAQHATEQARVLIAQLLAFSRRQALRPRAFDVNTTLIDTVRMLRRTLEANILIETVLSPDAWTAFADPNQLETALLNLAINARDAMPNGGRLTLQTGNAVLAAGDPGFTDDGHPGDYVFVSVSDDGTGMSAEAIQRAFEPFYTTKDVGKGSGLGLSQVYGFIKQSGGHVRIDSTLGTGTIVTLYVPRTLQTMMPDISAAAPIAPGSGERILLVEDDAEVRGAVHRMLTGFQYRVIAAADGEAALEALRQEDDIDLLFTDIMLPGQLNGRALAARARQMLPNIRILMTSGYAPTFENTEPDGFEIITKPYKRAELANRLRRILDGA